MAANRAKSRHDPVYNRFHRDAGWAVTPFQTMDFYLLDRPDDLSFGIPPLPADLEALEHSYTVWADGQPICCAGLTPIGLDAGEVWCYLSNGIKSYMLRVVNTMRRFLELYAPTRTEAYVDVDYIPGHRLVRALGFTPDIVLPDYCCDGRAHQRYVRFK